MMDALRTAGVGSTLGDGGAAHRERVRRAKQLQPKRPLTAAQLASEAACNAVIAEQRSINFARPADVTERRKRGEAVLSLQFDTLTIGDFVVGSAGGRQRSGRWAPPQRGPQAPPAAQTVGYSRSSEGLWASTDTEATVLAPAQSGASDRWASRVSSRIEQAEMSCICPICSKDGKVCMHVPSELSLAAAADAGHKWVPPPNYKPGARTEAEKAPHLPQICLAQAVLDVLPDGPRVQGRKKDAAVSPPPPAALSSSASRPVSPSGPSDSVAIRWQPRRARAVTLVWTFAHDWVGGNVAKVEVNLGGVCALKRSGRMLTISVSDPAKTTRRYVGTWHNGAFSHWQAEAAGVDFSSGECSNAGEHVLVARRKADMEAFCERIAASSRKFAALLEQSAQSKASAGQSVTFADETPTADEESVSYVSFGSSTSAAGGESRCGSSRSRGRPSGDDWNKKAWNQRPALRSRGQPSQAWSP